MRVYKIIFVTKKSTKEKKTLESGSHPEIKRAPPEIKGTYILLKANGVINVVYWQTE